MATGRTKATNGMREYSIDQLGVYVPPTMLAFSSPARGLREREVRSCLALCIGKKYKTASRRIHP